MELTLLNIIIHVFTNSDLRLLWGLAFGGEEQGRVGRYLLCVELPFAVTTQKL